MAKLASQDEQMLYCFLAKVYNITIQSDFLTGSNGHHLTAGTITYSPGVTIYSPGETKTDYHKEDVFTPFRSVSH